MRTVAAVLGAVLVAGLLGGCGYRTVIGGDPISGVNGVNVVMFANKSYQACVEAVLARDLVDELALRTGGRVLPGDQAELELTGTVLSYGSSAVSYNAQDQIREYLLTISVEAILRNRLTRTVLWKSELVGSQVYPVNQNLALQRNSEEAAVARISRRLSQDIWQKIGERF